MSKYICPDPHQAPAENKSEQHCYWRTNMRLTLLLLSFWLAINFVVTFFARELNEINFLGFPFGFYMAAQGSLLLNLLITGIYSFYMNYLDRKYGVPEDKNT